MARLEEITVGASVIGIAGNAPVCIVAVKWYGNAVLEITFKDNSTTSSTEMDWSRLLVREVIRLVATANYNAERENKCG